MLSSIHPLGERVRHSRFGVTAAAYIVGALVGGAAIGLVLAGPARLVRGSPGGDLRSIIAVVVVGAAFAAELTGRPRRFPGARRQVNEAWLDEYRGWVYGFGFGVQLGVSAATHVTTAAIPAFWMLAVLSGSPTVAIVAGTAFGAIRGIALLSARNVTSRRQLQQLHARVARHESTARGGAAAALAATGLVMVGAALLTGWSWA